MTDNRAKKRCRCHGEECYASCGECPKCHHWSLDLRINMCERHQCAYDGGQS